MINVKLVEEIKWPLKQSSLLGLRRFSSIFAKIEFRDMSIDGKYLLNTMTLKTFDTFL